MSNQKIGFISLSSIIIGNIIGSGVLLLPKKLSAFGMISIWSYVISGLGLLAIGLLYSKMQIWLKCEGVHGPILKVFGKKYGQYAAILYWISVVAGNGALLTSLFSYLGLTSVSFVMCLMLSSFFFFLMTLFNCVDIKLVKIVEIFVAIVKVIPLIGIPLICFYKAFLSNADLSAVYNHISFSSGISHTLSHTLWAFLGIETAIVVGSKVYRPEKTIPRAMIFSTIIIILIYTLGLWTMMKLLPDLANSNAPYTDLFKYIIPDFMKSFASPIITSLAIFLILGSIYGWVFTTGVIVSDAAEDGLLPSFLSKKNKFGAPAIALSISSMLSVIFLLLTHQEDIFNHFDNMISFLTLLTFFIYFSTNIAFFKVVFQKKDFTFSNLFIGITAFIASITAIIIISSNLI